MLSRINTNHISFQKLVLEAIIIIFAVLVALAVDSWKEDSERQDRVQIATDSINEEVKRNLETCVSVLETNTKSAADLTVLINELEKGGVNDLEYVLALNELSDVAWLSSNNSQVTSWFEQKELFRIGRVYHEQGLYDAQIKNYREFFLTIDPDMSKLKKSKYVLRYLRAMNLRVEELIDLYRKYLAGEQVG